MRSITIGFFFISMILFSQEEQKVYEYIVYSTIEKKSGGNKYFDDFISKEKDTVQYELYRGVEKTLFVPIIKIDNSQERKFSLAKSFQKSRGSFYVDYESEVTENNIDFSGEKYIITRNFNEFNWEKTNEIDTIQGFICKKAVLKKTEMGIKKERNFVTTVWYDPSHEKDIAPFGLAGLIGLVVKVDFNGNQEVILSDIKKSNKTKKIKSFKKGERITWIEFDKILQERLEEFRQKRRLRGSIREN